jgi:type I restriction-modification system DNA methylase subunit
MKRKWQNWFSRCWNLRILDPCCGSGIFLVKAFQRLIWRWQRVHKRPPLVNDLKPILAENLMGVDINDEAVRVASFSLYLTMVE